MLIKFDSRSISSIIKSHGKKLFYNDDNLNSLDKALCAYCLCGVLDLTTDLQSGQRQLFTNEQWTLLKKVFKSRASKSLPKLSFHIDHVIQKIKKVSFDYIFISRKPKLI